MVDVTEIPAPVVGSAGDGHSGPGEGLGFREGKPVWCELGMANLGRQSPGILPECNHPSTCPGD